MAAKTASLPPGQVVEYLQDNLPLIGYVVAEENNHLKVLNINKRDVKLQKARALPWSGPRLDPGQSREELLQQLDRINRLRQEIQDQLDPVELWELTEGETEEESAEWFSSLIWKDPGPDRVAAVGRLLLQCRTYFKFTPPVFQILSREKVEQKLQQQEKERWRNRLITEGQALFQALWKEGPGSGPLTRSEPDPEISEELKSILLQHIAADPAQGESEIWKSLTRGLPNNHHLALLLAELWGLVPRHYNHLLDQEEYAWGDQWSDKYAREISDQAESYYHLQQSPEHLPLVSIDSSTTWDIDDAFALEKEKGGNFRLYIALSRPSLTWQFDTPLDREVAHRASSLYLPEGTSHMLPETLGTDLYSLRQGRSTPALLLEILLDEGGEPVNAEPRLTWVEVKRNTTYDKVEQELSSSQDEYNLGQALELAQKLRRNRIRSGAVILEQQEPVIQLTPEGDDYRIDLQPATEHPEAQLIVSEFMILANSLLSDWAQANDLPLFHRSQDIRLSPGSAGEWKDPVQSFRIIQEMASSQLETRPEPHASLGIHGYAPVSSPLRRYVDFLNLAQIQSFLEKGQPTWSREQMEAMLPYLSARSQAANRIQKGRFRYWKLLYFQRWCKLTEWEGIVVDYSEPITVSLPREQMLLRAPKHMFGEKIYPGQKFRLTLGKIDPLNNQIKVIDAREE